MQSEALDIHLIAIGGTGMAPLACLLKEAGHRVRGSDGALYPPMSTLLEAAGIEPFVGFDTAHLEPTPDLVIVGNAVPRSNPEAMETERRGLSKMSMPEALAKFFLHGRRPLVIAGTHGKTTTSSLAAWVWTACDGQPGYLIGGIPANLASNFGRGSGERFIIEGDEYNAAYFDRGAKFLHYRAETLVLTSVEYDHADLYPDEASLLAAYERLVEGLPADGLLIAFGDAPAVRRVATKAPCRTLFYGLGEDNDIRPAAGFSEAADGVRLEIENAEWGRQELFVPLHGEHNVVNSLAVWAAARADGLGAEALLRAFRTFRGVKRRAEALGTANDITVVDDFAHHPTAVATTLQGLRARFPGRRLCVAFEPRSLTTARNLFFDAYADALARADLVFLAPIYYAARLEPHDQLDLVALADHLANIGIRALRAASNEELLELLIGELAPGDVLITMSSGSFDGLPRRLLERLGRARDPKARDERPTNGRRR